MSCLVGNSDRPNYIDDYKIVGMVGVGGQGEAYLVEDKKKAMRVLKIYARSTVNSG